MRLRRSTSKSEDRQAMSSAFALKNKIALGLVERLSLIAPPRRLRCSDDCICLNRRLVSGGSKSAERV